MEHLTYEEKLENWGLHSLVKRQLRKDMTEVDKITYGLEKVERRNPFSLFHNTRTKGIPMKLLGSKARIKKAFLYSACS